jgi:hypothetical protein
MDTPQDILEAFALEGRKGQPFERMVAMLKADPAQAFRILDLALGHYGKCNTFLHTALSFVADVLCALSPSVSVFSVLSVVKPPGIAPYANRSAL